MSITDVAIFVSKLIGEDGTAQVCSLFTSTTYDYSVLTATKNRHRPRVVGFATLSRCLSRRRVESIPIQFKVAIRLFFFSFSFCFLLSVVVVVVS